jgi:lipoprotein-releasing system ATP-binding protein
MNKILLETINIKKTYDHSNGNITLFDNLNLKIKEGDLIALVGPSGSGKSSLLHLFALLDDPSKGKILINNKETSVLDEGQKEELRRENISIIFQDNNLLTDFTALENVMMPLLIKGEKKKKILSKAKKILKDVKILNRADHFSFRVIRRRTTKSSHCESINC